MSLQWLWLRVSRDKLLIIGGILVLALVLTGVLADFVAPYSPFALHVQDRLEPPSSRYLLGTDWGGRDILSRLIYGTRITLEISFAVVFLAGLGGISLGLFAGYFGPPVDTAVTALTNLIFAFPSLVLALTISVRSLRPQYDPYDPRRSSLDQGTGVCESGTGRRGAYQRNPPSLHSSKRDRAGFGSTDHWIFLVHPLRGRLDLPRFWRSTSGRFLGHYLE